jgi:ribonucleotide reductase alpha subunit
MDTYREFIHISRYARFIPEENRRETWDETVDRYIDYFKDKVKKDFKGAKDKIPWDELREEIYNQNIMPSMRAMMTAGKALDRDNVAGYNCSYVAVDHPRVFDEVLYILMCGTGVGFSVERQFIAKLPEIEEEFYPSETTIVVKDSKIGWAEGYKQLISLLYRGSIPKWDLGKVRGAGERLKTFGGRASGPEPLDDLFKFTVATFKNAKGRKLNSTECHDLMCKIADVVICGGVRRSALLSLSNLTDERMQKAKHGEWWNTEPHRALANISVCYTEKPDMGIFMREWQNLYESKSGERGIFNRVASQKMCPERRDENFDFGTNPCSEIVLRSKQFCVAPTTPLITDGGIKEIKDFSDQSVNIWNGEEWTPVIVRQTGSNQRLMRVWLNDGSYLDCTPDHRWSVKDRFKKDWSEVQTKDLMSFSKYSIQVEPAQVSAPKTGKHVDNAYTLGFAVGDGCVYDNKVLIDCYGDKDIQCPIEGSRHKIVTKPGYNVESCRINASAVISGDMVLRLKNDLSELAAWDKSSVLNFLAGLADADGSQASNGIRIYLSHEHRARQLQLVLTRVGIRSSCNLHSSAGTETNLGTRKSDLWYIQITKTNEIPCHRLVCDNDSEPKFKGKYQNIVGVEELDGLYDTYCFNEPKKHKGLFGNVLTYQCNLTEVVVRPTDSIKRLKAKVRLATILGTIQSTCTNFRYLSRAWKTNTEEERLLGVSLTGIMDHTTLSNVEEMGAPLRSMKEVAIETNKEVADLLGIPQSTATTCVKPSGTVSQLVNSSSGIHPRFAPHYIRTVRQDKKDPLAAWMAERGIPVEEDVMFPNNVVFSFPQKSPKNSIMRNDMRAIDQLNHWAVVATEWCEHKPSITVYVREEEWLEVGAWIYENWDIVNGISFLPYTDHVYRQAPYQEVTKEEYDEHMKLMPKNIDFSTYKENADHTIASQELACASAAGCEF